MRSYRKTWEQHWKLLRMPLAKWRTEEKRKNARRTPKVRKREEAAARCTKVIKRGVLKKARKARADMVTCSLAPGRKCHCQSCMSTVHERHEWQKELQRHCDEVHTDETREKQEQTLNISKRKLICNLRQMEEEPRSQLTWYCKPVQRCLKTRSKGLEDAVVSEMIKQLPLEKISTITKCFQERFMGQMEAPSSWKLAKERNPRAEGPF